MDIVNPPTHVLTRDAVRWGIDTLGRRRLHPTFVMYLYLRTQERAGNLATASASSDELTHLIELPGNPQKPYYFPLITRGRRSGTPLSTFWRAGNISGSWSPGSIHRQQGGGWLGTDDGSYVFPDSHAERALREMLFSQPVPAIAMGAYFLRNDGLILSGPPGGQEVIDAFRMKFDYPDDAEDEYRLLFSDDVPEVHFEWLEPFVVELEEDLHG